MDRFVALAWNSVDSNLSQRAATARSQLRENLMLPNVLDTSGLSVFAKISDGSTSNCYALGGGEGVIIGTVFARNNFGQAPTEFFRGHYGHLVTTSRGRFLIDKCWGRYVAFLYDSESLTSRVIHDPIGAPPVFRANVNGIYVYFSDILDFHTFTQASLSVDWGYLAAHSVLPILNGERTAIDGVNELQGGLCDEISSNGINTEVYWDPASFAADPLEDFGECVNLLRDTLVESTANWASCFSSIALQLSGGIDSSILAACLNLISSPPTVTGLHFFAEGYPGADERPYARLVARHTRISLIERPIVKSSSFAIFSDIRISPRPALYLNAPQEVDTISIADGIGASAIFTGNGGDALFGLLVDPAIPIDYIHNLGPRLGLLKAVASTAKITRQSWLSIIRTTLSQSLFRPAQQQSPLLTALPLRRLLTDDAKALVQDRGDHYSHSWLRSVGGLPPAKQRHIGMVSLPSYVESTLRQGNHLKYIHPITNQRMLELSLRIPTYLLTSGGATRAIARAAFKDHLPSELYARQTKGNPATVISDMLRFNRDTVRDMLLAGQLVSNNLLCKRSLEQFFSDSPTDISPTEVLFHFCTEYWVNCLNHAAPSSVHPHVTYPARKTG